MSFNAGTLSGGATPAAELMNTVQPLIDAHPAWVFVETVAGTVTTTKRVDVYRCLGTLNALGTDFFMAISRGSDAGAVQVLFFENYNTSTKQATNGFYNATAAIAVNADGTNAQSSVAKHVADASTNPIATANFLSGPSQADTAARPTGATIAASTPYFLSVTNDAVVLCCAPLVVYVGLYDSSYSTTLDPFPLCGVYLQLTTGFSGTVNVSTFGSSGGGNGGYTRELGGAIASQIYPGSGYPDRSLIAPVGNGTSAIQKDPISGLWTAGRVALGSNVRRGVRRGLLKAHVLAIPMAEVSEGNADTITIDGATYVCVNNASISPTTILDSIWVNQAA